MLSGERNAYMHAYIHIHIHIDIDVDIDIDIDIHYSDIDIIYSTYTLMSHDPFKPGQDDEGQRVC